MNTVKILVGDALTQLKTMPDASVHCCVTSPPYYGLRDYGIAGQIGLEETPEAYVAKLVEVFREVRRVLRDDATLWLNLGDSYSAKTKGTGGTKSLSAGGLLRPNGRSQPAMEARKFNAGGLCDKQLLGVPWRVAFALQSDGWILRQDIIWSKPNPMPESVKDRCTKAHEYLFLLAKSKRYWFDSEAMKEDAIWAGKRVVLGEKSLSKGQAKGAGVKASGNGLADHVIVSPYRNRRSVWTLPTRPYKGAHFAVFPPALVEPCIKAGCPAGGVVLDPFGGSGTTGQVAKSLGRDAILIELNPSYIPLIEARVV